jgi:hypothetical protein
MTVWYAGRNFIPTCIPDGHPYKVTNTRCPVSTVFSPDDGHIDARKNAETNPINILRKKVCTKLVLFTEIIQGCRVTAGSPKRKEKTQRES